MKGRFPDTECSRCGGSGTLNVTDNKPVEKGGRGLGVFKEHNDGLWIFKKKCHVCGGKGCHTTENKSVKVIGTGGGSKRAKWPAH